MKSETYVQLILREARRLKGLADQAMAQVSDEAFFSAFGDEDNSIAILIKHLAGNMSSRWRDFLTSDGEKPDRHRDTEFILTADDTLGLIGARIGLTERSVPNIVGPYL